MSWLLIQYTEVGVKLKQPHPGFSPHCSNQNFNLISEGEL